MIKISKQDEEKYKAIRDNVSLFIKRASEKYDRPETLLLDIAPEIHKGASEHFFLSQIKTLDLDQGSGATYIADLCQNNSDIIPDNYFDLIICTEVLEHTNNPFIAVEELLRMVKKGGHIYVSTPFNFRMHGPLPDNWRFTTHGLNQLFKNAEEVLIEDLPDSERDLMPIHYTLIAKK